MGNHNSFREALAQCRQADKTSENQAREYLDRLTKPVGSLGALEDLAAQLSAIQGRVPPAAPSKPALAIFAGDHGVLEEGVTPWPQEVTTQMVLNFLSGGAAVNSLAKSAGASVVVVDVGVASIIDWTGVGDGDNEPRFIDAKVRPGTGNLASGPAMTIEEAEQALSVGASLACEMIADGADLLLTGDMGIGNTSPSAALIAAITGKSAHEVTGRGTGIDDDHLERKVAAIEAGLARANPSGINGVDGVARLLAELGGIEIAAIAGYIVGGASLGVPVVMDGVISNAAGLVAVAAKPEILDFLIAGHRSTEPGASAAIEYFGLSPVIDLNLRLGEGTGACLAVPVIQASARVMSEMATFDSAGVTDKT